MYYLLMMGVVHQGPRVWCGCRHKAALFFHLRVPECVCVWCDNSLKRALAHMGTNDRILFSEVNCKKMKRPKLVEPQIKKMELRSCQTSH